MNVHHLEWAGSRPRCSEFNGFHVNPLASFLTFLISSSFLPGVVQAAAESALSGWTACSSRMLLVLGQRLGFFYTPTTPFHQAGTPTTINQSGDSPWMSVNMLPSLPLFSHHFPFRLYICLTYDCSFPVLCGLLMTCSCIDFCYQYQDSTIESFLIECRVFEVWCWTLEGRETYWQKKKQWAEKCFDRQY